MLKKDITYTDIFTGESKTEPFFFNFTEMELVRLQVELDGKLKEKIEAIGSGEASNKEILRFFEDFISKSYGERKGDHFIKNQDVVDSFLASAPYSALMISFFEEATDAAEFLNGLMPPELIARADARRKEEEAVSKAAESWPDMEKNAAAIIEHRTQNEPDFNRPAAPVSRRDLRAEGNQSDIRDTRANGFGEA